MKRYLVTSFLLLVPLYGISKATAELVKSMSPRNDVPTLVHAQVVAASSQATFQATPQLTKTED